VSATRSFPVEWLERHHIAVTGMSDKVVHRQFVEHQEYGSLWSAVIQDDNRYWKVSYLEPNTSEVHVDTWFDELDVKGEEVFPRGTFVTQWVPKKWDTSGTCAEAFGPNLSQVCGEPAPFLVALRSGITGIETTERCERHLRMMFLSPELVEALQEVRRRWH